MNYWFLTQILFNVILFSLLIIIWSRLRKPAKDDPRLSRGLQVLQSKISILEDLSDRTESQVSQLTALLEQKCLDLQKKIDLADSQMLKIEQSMNKSIEVAQIFQDKIPHQEIIERQNTIKYVKAAKLAHQGYSAEDISKQVDLSVGEIEFIAKVNRNNLMFSEKDLPTWAQQEILETPNSDDFALKTPFTYLSKTPPVLNLQNETSIKETFIENMGPAPVEVPQIQNIKITPTAPLVTPKIQTPIPQNIATTVNAQNVKNDPNVQIIEREGKKPLIIKPFEFKRIDFKQNLS